LSSCGGCADADPAAAIEASTIPSVNADPDSQRCLSRIEVDAETRAGTATTFEMKTVMTTGETKSRHAHSP
jgi:hypothetical protein